MDQSTPPPSEGKEPLGADLVIPVLAVAFTAYFFVSVAELTWEAKANAVIIGSVLLALVAVFAVRAAWRVAAGGADFSFQPLVEPRQMLRPRALIVGLTALFIVLIPWLGLTLGLFLLVAALMLVLGAVSWRTIALTSGTVAVIAYLLFIALLNSRLPRGPIEKLLAGLF